MMRDECSNDLRSLDAEKITAIHTSGGNQYLIKIRTRDIGTKNSAVRRDANQL